jgi:hopene-associated glycosyltransferase HpnB
MSLVLIAAAAILAWVYLALARGMFWRASERLTAAPAPESWPQVVAIIPARDEAETIGAVVRAHLTCRYPGDFSVIVIDDQSADGTADIARTAAQDQNVHSLEILSGIPLPEGWSGKLWAMHQGLTLAQAHAPEADYLLLTDADIMLAPDTLSTLVSKAECEGLSLASLMARLDARGGWAQLLVPAFIYFFQKLYPFPLVNDPNENLAAAAGGCMLVRAGALKKAGGVAAIKSALIDDCALARRIKALSPSTKIWLGLADDEAVSLRDNRQLSSLWNMVARTAYAQLAFSPILLIGTVAGMALVYLAAPLIVITLPWHGNITALLYASFAWGIMAYTYWPTLKLYHRPPWEAAFLPVAAGLYTMMTVTSALRHWRGEGGQWKGRIY